MYQRAPSSSLDSTNQIICATSPGSRLLLWPFLERVHLARREVLSRPTGRTEHFYFIETGMVSLIRSMQNGQGVELGAVGREGIAPPGPPFAFKRVAFESIVQIAGTALRIRREDLELVLARDSELLQLMRGYASVALSQLAQTAACNILHLAESRCSRWLLQAHDCAGADSFAITHELLGMILGVRRATVSAAAEKLQRAGVIRYHHGNVAILNRRGLERTACECYATMKQEFATLFC